MKLFILRRPKPRNADASTICRMLIRAKNETNAREIAAEMAEGRSKAVWLNGAKSVCSELVTAGEPGLIIMEDAR